MIIKTTIQPISPTRSLYQEEFPKSSKHVEGEAEVQPNLPKFSEKDKLPKKSKMKTCVPGGVRK